MAGIHEGDRGWNQMLGWRECQWEKTAAKGIIIVYIWEYQNNSSKFVL